MVIKTMWLSPWEVSLAILMYVSDKENDICELKEITKCETTDDVMDVVEGIDDGYFGEVGNPSREYYKDLVDSFMQDYQGDCADAYAFFIKDRFCGCISFKGKLIMAC